MNTTKLLTTSAVATALLPFASLAAIDDQGMQYVTAAEGLHGSLRVNILKNEDDDTNDVTTGGAKDSLRLWITGSGDIGHGWSTTYYWEVRDGDPGTSGTIGTNAWDVGLKGPFGSFSFGRLGMVAPRLVPGGSLDTVAGGEAASFASDPDNNGLRFESAVFNGIQFGISGTANGDELTGETTGATPMPIDEDDFFDEYSFAVKYSSPLGFQVGAGYEVDIMHDERFVNATVADVADYDDKSGWRLGARYGQDNWLLGYEYRSYEGFSPWETNLNFLTGNVANAWFSTEGIAFLLTAGSGGNTGNTAASLNVRPAGSQSTVGAEFNSQIKYTVHRMGVQVKLDRLTTSAGYSLESQGLDIAGAAEIERTALAVDAAYHLGLNSLLAVGWKKVKTEQWVQGIPNAVNSTNRTTWRRASDLTRAETISDKTTMQLYYRVDF